MHTPGGIIAVFARIKQDDAPQDARKSTGSTQTRRTTTDDHHIIIDIWNPSPTDSEKAQKSKRLLPDEIHDGSTDEEVDF